MQASFRLYQTNQRSQQRLKYWRHEHSGCLTLSDCLTCTSCINVCLYWKVDTARTYSFFIAAAVAICLRISEPRGATPSRSSPRTRRRGPGWKHARYVGVTLLLVSLFIDNVDFRFAHGRSTCRNGQDR